MHHLYLMLSSCCMWVHQLFFNILHQFCYIFLFKYAFLCNWEEWTLPPWHPPNPNICPQPSSRGWSLWWLMLVGLNQLPWTWKLPRTTLNRLWNHSDAYYMTKRTAQGLKRHFPINPLNVFIVHISIRVYTMYKYPYNNRRTGIPNNAHSKKECAIKKKKS